MLFRSLPGTTTATSIATDSSGGTTVASMTTNAAGVWEVSGNEVVPHIDRKVKWGIFQNSTHAAANTPFAIGPFDNVEQTQGASSNAWVLSSSTPTQTSATTFTVTGDKTADFQAGRRVQLTDSSTLYGVITSSAYTTLTTVTVVLDSGSLTGSLSAVYLSLISTTDKEVDAQAVAYRPAGTGAVATDVQTKLRESVSVKDFGAVGDGVTDDTTAIQAALDYSNHVIIPIGTYKISSTLNVVAGKRLEGFGFDSDPSGSFNKFRSLIVPTAAVTGAAIDVEGSDNVVSNITLDGTATTGVIGWRIGNVALANLGYMDNCHAWDFSGSGAKGIQIVNVVQFKATNCYFSSNLENLDIGSTASASLPTTVTFDTCTFHSAGTFGEIGRAHV